MIEEEHFTVDCPHCKKSLTVKKTEEGYSALSRLKTLLRFLDGLSVEDKKMVQRHALQIKIPLSDYLEEVMTELLSTHVLCKQDERLEYACKIVRTKH